MDAIARGWLHKTAAKHYWRVCKWYDLADLVQDGYLTYYRIRERYDTATDAKHVMSLFRVSYLNHITSLARLRRRRIDEINITDMFEDGANFSEEFLFQAVCQSSDVPSQISVGDLSPEVVKVIKTFDDPTALKKMRAPFRKGFDGKRETTNQRLCRMIGIDPKRVNLRRMLNTDLGEVES